MTQGVMTPQPPFITFNSIHYEGPVADSPAKATSCDRRHRNSSGRLLALQSVVFTR
jgi:hypothetical protein